MRKVGRLVASVARSVASRCRCQAGLGRPTAACMPAPSALSAGCPPRLQQPSATLLTPSAPTPNPLAPLSLPLPPHPPPATPSELPLAASAPSLPFCAPPADRPKQPSPAPAECCRRPHLACIGGFSVRHQSSSAVTSSPWLLVVHDHDRGDGCFSLPSIRCPRQLSLASTHPSPLPPPTHPPLPRR